MLDTEHMLIHDPFVPNPSSGPEEYTLGFTAYVVGFGWDDLGSSAAHR